MSASLSSGAITVFIPARWAASDFSLSPPIGSTWPLSVISPVIATSPRTGAADQRGERDRIVTPADGPSLGIAPAGTWMWMSCSANQSSPSRRDLFPVAAHVGERRLRRLLHRVAELAGDRQLARARHRGRLDEEDVAAGRRPGEPGCHAGSLVRRRCSAKKRRRPSSSRARLAGDPHLALRLALGDVAGDLAADRADLALQVADAGLARVLLDDRGQRRVGELDLGGLEAVGLDLARHQVAAGDVELLLQRVAGELDHLHPVPERPGDGVEDVGGGDEHHLGEVEPRSR